MGKKKYFFSKSLESSFFKCHFTVDNSYSLSVTDSTFSALGPLFVVVSGILCEGRIIDSTCENCQLNKELPSTVLYQYLFFSFTAVLTRFTSLLSFCLTMLQYSQSASSHCPDKCKQLEQQIQTDRQSLKYIKKE